MKTRIAWHNLLHHRRRTVVGVAGVAFAIVLVFMQLGFLGAVEYTATLIYGQLEFDLVLRSPGYLHFAEPRSFPRRCLQLAAADPAVSHAQPLYAELAQWRNPHADRRAGESVYRGILVMGLADGPCVFRTPEIQQAAALLTSDEFVLIDRKSRTEFGPADGRRFGDQDVGVQAELGEKRVTIAGHYELGATLAVDGTVLMSDAGFERVIPGRTREQVSLGLLRLERGARPAEVAARLKKSLPPDVTVLTRQEAVDFELRRWVWETSIGIIFQLGVAVALVVGTAVVYQVLSTDVANHLSEYATLKAMGYSAWHLAGIVLEQAVILGLLGYVPAVLFTLGLYEVTSRAAGIPITMNAARLASVLVMSLAMCAGSGLGAMRKLSQLDPAELY